MKLRFEDMKMKRIMASAAAVLAIVACGTQKRTVSGETVQSDSGIDPKSAAASGLEFAPASPKDTDSFYWNGHLAFGLSLFSAALKESADGDNVVVSPFSAGTALSMLAEGATGQTREEILNAIQRTSYFAHELQQDTSYIISRANSIWANENFNVRDEYRKTLQETYRSDLYVKDFSKKSTVRDINRWCSEKTSGRIPEIIDEISPDMVLFLLNALYFKAPWENPFNADATYDAVFHAASGDVKVPFMHLSENLCCGSVGGNKYVILPYKSGDYQMIVCLPADGADISDVASHIDASVFSETLKNAEFQDVVLSLPKFKVNTSKTLNGVLQTLGVKKAFTNAAEFDLMTDVPVAVDKVLQKCFVEVNEEGAEAAAVTSVGMRLTSVMAPREKFVMNVNRPFLFAIFNAANDEILFAGKIAKTED